MGVPSTMSGEERLSLAHGAGGAVMSEMVQKHIISSFEHELSRLLEVPPWEMDDASVIDGVAFTTDTYTVRPLFFPGGDIGLLAVAGTINDISVLGAEPLALSCGLVLEEGLPFSDLEKVLQSMGLASRQAGVPIITGDTKVVERGGIDKMVVNTSGIGRQSPHLAGNLEVVRKHRPFEGNWLRDSCVKPGDKIIVSGTVGDHGVAILSFREGYGFETELRSDAQPLNHMIKEGLRTGGVTAIKDPTRGGLANTLNEWADKSKTGILIRELDVPLKPAVTSACELLGIDPLSIGNEGKAVFAVVPEMADAVLKALRATPEGRDAVIIGKATDEVKGVVMETEIGGRKIVEQPVGDPVPRIC